MSSFQIRIDQSVAHIAEELAGITDDSSVSYGNQRIFPTMAEAINFAALVGFRAERRRPIENARKDPIRSQIFESNQLQGYIYLMAVANTGDIEILRDENFEESVQLYEEYAFGGFSEIEDWGKETGKPLFERILNEMTKVAAILQEAQHSQNSSKKPVIIRKKRSRSLPNK